MPYPDPIDEYGDVMTLEEFEPGLTWGPVFTDGDGFGYFAKDGFAAKERFYPSEYFITKPRFPDATHVVWFNR